MCCKYFVYRKHVAASKVWPAIYDVVRAEVLMPERNFHGC